MKSESTYLKINNFYKIFKPKMTITKFWKTHNCTYSNYVTVAPWDMIAAGEEGTDGLEGPSDLRFH
jgi:hypothetical protein